MWLSWREFIGLRGRFGGHGHRWFGGAFGGLHG
jgi:hypothetical protein